MKKFYRIVLLLIILVFITTYNPHQLSLISDNKIKFFNIKNISVENNLLIKKTEIEDKLKGFLIIIYENCYMKLVLDPSYL